MSMPKEESLLLQGRWSVSEECLCASAPAASVSFNATASEVSFDIEGEARFLFEIDLHRIIASRRKGIALDFFKQ